jgi:hypothetical protein
VPPVLAVLIRAGGRRAALRSSRGSHRQALRAYSRSP